MRNPPEGQFHLQRPTLNDNDTSGWTVIKMNTGGVFPGNPNSVMIKNSKVSPGISIFECVAVDDRAELLALLIRTVTVEVFTTGVSIDLLHTDGTSDSHHMDELNVSPICNNTGNVTGVAFAKFRAYGSCMEDPRVKDILELIYEKSYVSNNVHPTAAGDPRLELFSYTAAKRALTDLGHPPRLYMGENDNQAFFDTTCGGSWIKYMTHYAIIILTCKQRACFWSDTVMHATDILHYGLGAFQNDHIESLINGNGVGNKLFDYDVRQTDRNIIAVLREGSKTGLTYFYYHAILKKVTRDSMRQTIPEGRYVPNSQIKLPIEILDDDVYQPFIDEYKSMHANPMGVDRARLEGFTGDVNIDVEDVAYFNLDKWNSYKAIIRQSRNLDPVWRLWSWQKSECRC
jgi:hypothetical protein